MNYKIDLQRLTHYDAIRTLEKELILSNICKYDAIEIITGKSPILQEKLIIEVIERYDFEWFIPPGNIGMIIVAEKYMFI
jgi:hypothetical protein|tara:strand:- start:102 stop:341 length:240 start_codon:yes stop_codon:yes gene_type:complete